MNNKSNSNNNNNSTANNIDNTTSHIESSSSSRNTNNNSNNSNNISTNNNNISENSSPTRSSREEREFEQQRRQPQHILLMKSNKMFKRCCCYMLILCLALILPANVAPMATEGNVVVVTTDAPPSSKRLTSAAEILQLPHAFRHEEHYSHRIEQAVNDFKRAQMQQLKERDKNLTTRTPYTSVDNNDNNNNNNNNMEYENNYYSQSLQFEPHHRRHEQHYLQHNIVKSNNNNQKNMNINNNIDNKKVYQHRLRHSHSHSNGQHNKWEERVLPPMRHQRHQLQQQHQQQQQNFDGLSMNLGEGKSSRNQRLTLHLKADTFGDDFDDSNEYHDDDDTSNNNSDDYDDDDSSDASDEDIDTDDDSSDDDSYDDSESKEFMHQNMFPRSTGNSYSSVDGKAASVKRYTNPFKNYKTNAAAIGTKKRWNFFDEQKPAQQRPTNDRNDKNMAHNNRASFLGIADNNNNHNHNGDGDAGHDHVDVSDTNNDDFEIFSNEKWRQIKDEHFRRQQEHQHEMMALRLNHNPLAASRISQHEQQHHNKNEDIIVANNNIPGALSRKKIEELGTADAVKKASRKELGKKSRRDQKLASAHYNRISNEAACRIPQRRVERIQLHTAKIYIPHCTVLHRCADDTGCCHSQRETCAPKSTQSVDLYFSVKDMNKGKPTIERLTFINHTECHCVERSQHKADEYHETSLIGISNRHDYSATILSCNCPKFFEKILQEDGRCRCDCSSGNTGCKWLKSGMEHFSVMDRKCILEGQCQLPTCEYGTYMKKHGRCPRLQEQLS